MGMPLNRQGGRVRAPLGGGRAKIENSSRRHPRKFGQKRFLAVRRSWRGNGVACLWATSLEKIFGGELRRLHHRQIGGLFTFEDATSIDADQPVHLDAPCVLVPVPRHPRKIGIRRGGGNDVIDPKRKLNAPRSGMVTPALPR